MAFCQWESGPSDSSEYDEGDPQGFCLAADNTWLRTWQDGGGLLANSVRYAKAFQVVRNSVQKTSGLSHLPQGGAGGGS